VTSKIAAISHWWFPHVLTPEEEAAAEEAKKAPKPEPIQGTNSKAQEAFKTQLFEMRDKWLKKDDMYCAFSFPYFGFLNKDRAWHLPDKRDSN
jgi:hypothetical protein